jgi:hypothetical protein
MRRSAAQQVQPLLQLATLRPQPQCTGNCSIAKSCKDAAASQSGTAAAACAAESAAARAHSGRHAATSGRRLAAATSIQSSSRAYAATAGTRSRSVPAAHESLAPPATGLARWGATLRPLAACAVSQPWPLGRQHTPYADGGSARSFASQPIGRITPEGFTEKAWEVHLPNVSASVSAGLPLIALCTAQPSTSQPCIEVASMLHALRLHVPIPAVSMTRFECLQAISTAPQLAGAAGQQLVQPEHLAKALLEQVRHVFVLISLPSDRSVTVQSPQRSQ